MNELIKIPPVIAECIGLCFNSLISAREYARSIATDPLTDKRVQNEFMSFAASMSVIVDRIERRVPKHIRDAFNEQVADSSDPLRLENIKALYLRMDEDQKQSLESCAEAILSGNFKIEKEA